MRAIEAIRDSVTMADIYHELGLRFDDKLLARGGKMSCQIHGADNDPSAFYYPDKKRVHCFACGFDGDVLDVAQKVLGLRDMAATINWFLQHFPKIDFTPVSSQDIVPAKFKVPYEDLVKKQILETVADRVWERIDAGLANNGAADYSILFSFSAFSEWAKTVSAEAILVEANTLLDT